MSGYRLVWWKYLAPGFWPVWAALALLRPVVYLPYSWQNAIGKGLGRLAYLFVKKRRHIASVNIDICFPDLDERQREAMLKSHFESVGMAITDTVLCWWGSDRKLRSICRFRGVECLERARKGGRGVLLSSGHFTSVELMTRLLSLHVPGLRLFYRPNNNPLINAIQYAAYIRNSVQFVNHTDTRTMLRGLKQGQVFYYLPDQDYHGKLSAFVSFFGYPAATTTGASQITRLSGAAVVPFFPKRIAGAAYFEMTFYPELDGFPCGDEIKDTQSLMSVLEGMVREVPEQYLWIHRRFKSRPQGSVSPY